MFIDTETDAMFVPGKNFLVTRKDMKIGFPLGEHFVELLFNLCVRLNAYHLEDTEKALFSALVLISPGRYYFMYILIRNINLIVVCKQY